MRARSRKRPWRRASGSVPRYDLPGRRSYSVPRSYLVATRCRGEPRRRREVGTFDSSQLLVPIMRSSLYVAAVAALFEDPSVQCLRLDEDDSTGLSVVTSLPARSHRRLRRWSDRASEKLGSGTSAVPRYDFYPVCTNWGSWPWATDGFHFVP